MTSRGKSQNNASKKKEKRVIDFYEIIGLVAAFITTASFFAASF